MKNYKKSADAITITNGSGSTMAAGSLQKLNTKQLVGVPIDDILDTKSGEVVLSGVFEFAKEIGSGDSQKIAQFGPCYVDGTSGKITKIKGSDAFAGLCAKAVVDADAKVQVIINKQSGVAADIQAT